MYLSKIILSFSHIYIGDIMTTFHLLLLIIAGGILYLFFKQLFSGEYPKRGIDFEAKTADEQIGGIMSPDKIFSRNTVELSRIDQLLQMADIAVEEKDYDEAKKALGSALIIEEKNIEALQKMGYISLQTKDYVEAKECFNTLIEVDENDDMAHVSIANTYHKLGDESKAEFHHEKAIAIDADYAPHHFNYANTLYDQGRTKEALTGYQFAYELDNSLAEAKNMIDKLSV